MRRFLFILAPVILLILAFRPVSSHPVSGKVTDDHGTPIQGASVVIKGTNIATLSSSDGVYTLTVANKNETLVFAAVGYESKEVKINGRSIVNVSLTLSVQNLQEVVVTGHPVKKSLRNDNAYDRSPVMA